MFLLTTARHADALEHVQNSTVFRPLIYEARVQPLRGSARRSSCHKRLASHFIPTKILVPVDFSSSSDAALETASDLAQHFHAELYLLNVIPMLPMGTKNCLLS